MPHRKPLSDEVKAKISASRKGQSLSEETKLKISRAVSTSFKKGRKPLSEEGRASLRESRKKPRPHMKGRKTWNAGLSMGIDPRLKKLSDSLSKVFRAKVKNGSYRKVVHSAAFIEAASKRMTENPPSWKCKWYEVKGEKVQGTWERDLAEKMESLGIRWLKRGTLNRTWIYIDNGFPRRYTPDFYLLDEKIQLEVKGFWWIGNREKMDLVVSQNEDARISIVESEVFRSLLSADTKEDFISRLGPVHQLVR